MESEKKAEEGRQSIDAYWTEERMRNAKPARDRVSTGQTDTMPPVVPGEPVTVPGSPPSDAGEPSDGTTRLASQKTYEVPDPTIYPARTAGKLFFQSAGTDWVGSACVIGPNLLLTVAHNLLDEKTKGWSSKIRFAPAYDERRKPDPAAYGYWTYHRAVVPKGWENTFADRYDLGLVIMNQGGTANRSVGDVVGYLGYSLNRTRERSWTEVGYPGNFFEGRRMMADEGHYTRMLDADAVIGKESLFEGGSSGAPWVLFGDPTVVNGVHSFRKSATYPKEAFSVYFSDWVGEFIQKTIAGSV